MGKKYTLKIFAVFSILIFLSGCALSTPKENPPETKGNSNSQVILYVGHGCTHCQLVEDYLNQKGISDKLNIKEVFENEQNAAEFQDKAKICGVDMANLGVPMLYTQGKCVEGDQPIIDWLKANIK